MAIFAAMVLTKQQVFSISNAGQFNDAALQLFSHQAQTCTVYRSFIEGLHVDAAAVKTIEQIPFLPIQFFKTHEVLSTAAAPEVVFSSSGTTGTTTSRHLVTDAGWYRGSFRQGFQQFYGDITNYTILALLPSYLERGGSSLVYMVEDLIQRSANPDSGFFLYNHDDLYHQLKKQQQNHKPTILIGVTYALLNFAEQFKVDFPELIIMETGGMKGQRREMVREELHHTLCRGFGVNAIHSEYGMTELLSQAYSTGGGIFRCVPWMKIITRDTNDPISILNTNRAGGINVIDLANINSCAFIATQDLGKLYPDGSFEVLGRFDNADIRGCNLLIA
jgi:phenylacetate-coenzyme A ligase PaaK-like adenylate-forming protein